jgi:glutathione synthase/RimK-type ligase-like ATP-grasp enzyme
VYKLLREFSPKTIFVDNETDFFEALKNITTEKVVLKPNTGTGGRGVRIFDKNDPVLDEKMKSVIAEGALLQEFIDTKHGIAGICDSYHDLRLAVVNDTIALVHVRAPEPGSLIANYQQGATIKELAREDLPEEVVAFHKKIHTKITEQFPKPMYTMDIGVGASGHPLLFEINGTTAFPWPEFQSKDFFIEQLATHLEHL